MPGSYVGNGKCTIMSHLKKKSWKCELWAAGKIKQAHLLMLICRDWGRCCCHREGTLSSILGARAAAGNSWSSGNNKGKELKIKHHICQWWRVAVNMLGLGDIMVNLVKCQGQACPAYTSRCPFYSLPKNHYWRGGVDFPPNQPVRGGWL